MEKKKNKVFNKTVINVFLDLALALVFAVEMEEHFTNLPLHEVLGLIFGTAFVIHIILHWDWILAITIGFFKQFLHESRLNYVLNIALFIAMGLATISGILISRTLGFHFEVGRSWEQIHRISADLSLLIVALHVAMHWKWIAQNGSKYLFGWVTKLSIHKAQES